MNFDNAPIDVCLQVLRYLDRKELETNCLFASRYNIIKDEF